MEGSRKIPTFQAWKTGWMMIQFAEMGKTR